MCVCDNMCDNDPRKVSLNGTHFLWCANRKCHSSRRIYVDCKANGPAMVTACEGTVRMQGFWPVGKSQMGWMRVGVVRVGLQWWRTLYYVSQGLESPLFHVREGEIRPILDWIRGYPVGSCLDSCLWSQQDHTPFWTLPKPNNTQNSIYLNRFISYGNLTILKDRHSKLSCVMFSLYICASTRWWLHITTL